MSDESVFENINNAINDARRIIENAEIALKKVAETQRSLGITNEVVEDYMRRYLTDDERRNVEMEVQRSLNEIREAAEDAVNKCKNKNYQLRRNRIGDCI